MLEIIKQWYDSLDRNNNLIILSKDLASLSDIVQQAIDAERRRCGRIALWQRQTKEDASRSEFARGKESAASQIQGMVESGYDFGENNAALIIHQHLVLTSHRDSND